MVIEYEKLTPKEKQIMLMIRQGYTVHYISKECHFAESTILNHLQNIYDKYGIPADKTYNRRLRAVYIFNQNEQFEYPLKILKCFKFIEKHISDYKQWLQQESEG